MIYAFQRRRIVQGCFALFALSFIICFVAVAWLAIPAEAWPLKALFIVGGLALSLALPGILADTFAPGPILTISADGICYLPFSRQTVPWPAVRTVTLTRGYSHAQGSNDYYRFKLMDGVSFVVDDPKRFPAPPGGLRANTVAISIVPMTVDASPDAIVAAIRASWPSGDIREVSAAPADATLH
ncbi:MAG: hypothetical protein KF779_07255 [Hyphomonadaceae bacterium]|nr:hypothetical protein [Hyphomonadaceae bacterium]